MTCVYIKKYVNIVKKADNKSNHCNYCVHNTKTYFMCEPPYINLKGLEK